MPDTAESLAAADLEAVQAGKDLRLAALDALAEQRRAARGIAAAAANLDGLVDDARKMFR